MSEYKRAIAELRKKISTRNAEIKKTKEKIGNELSGLELDTVKDTPLLENFKKAQDLNKEIPEKRTVILTIKKINNQLEGLNQKIAELKTGISDREKIFKSIYENIGNSAYAAFKQNRETLISYEEIFTGLIKQDTKCEQFNKVDISGSPEDKSIIRQFVDAAKSMYRNQKHKFILLRYPGLYRQAGKAILTTDFIEDAADGALDMAIKALIENEKAVKELHNDITELENKKANLREELAGLDVKGSPQKKISELKTEIEHINSILHDCYMSMGNLFLEHNLSTVTGNAKTGEYTRIISDLLKANNICETKIKRYETLIAIEKIDHKMLKTTNKIEHIKNQITRLDKEMKSLKDDLTHLAKQKKTYEKMLEKIPGQEPAAVPEQTGSVETG